MDEVRGWLKQEIDRTRDSIGRNIQVYTQHLSDCPLCQPSGYYDALGDISIFTTCPYCSGSYWINSEVETDVLARVHWVGNEAITSTPGGKYYMGEATATVDPSYHDLFVQAQNEKGHVKVDEQDMQILQIRPMGVPEINRYRIVLKSVGNRPDL